jgi:hypothetical protein
VGSKEAIVNWVKSLAEQLGQIDVVITNSISINLPMADYREKALIGK